MSDEQTRNLHTNLKSEATRVVKGHSIRQHYNHLIVLKQLCVMWELIIKPLISVRI